MDLSCRTAPAGLISLWMRTIVPGRRRWRACAARRMMFAGVPEIANVGPLRSRSFYRFRRSRQIFRRSRGGVRESESVLSLLLCPIFESRLLRGVSERGKSPASAMFSRSAAFTQSRENTKYTASRSTDVQIIALHVSRGYVVISSSV